jgi:hypothetical protein
VQGTERGNTLSGFTKAQATPQILNLAGWLGSRGLAGEGVFNLYRLHRLDRCGNRAREVAETEKTFSA